MKHSIQGHKPHKLAKLSFRPQKGEITEQVLRPLISGDKAKSFSVL